MGQGSALGFARREHAAPTLLVECDPTGKVLWTTQRAREILGDPEYLTDFVLVTVTGKSRRQRYRVHPFQFWLVWETGHSVIIAVRPPESPDRVLLDLLRMESLFLRKFFRLLAIELHLSEKAKRSRRPGGGKMAIRHIELERQRLARELHTGVGQALAAICMQAEVIDAEIPHPPTRVKQAISAVGELAAGALDLVRGVSQRLHPPEWQKLTLQTALRQLWELSGIPLRFHADLRIDRLPSEPVPEVKALLYRSLQEALSNLVRHSKARRVESRVQLSGDRVILSVCDDGVGFDVVKLLAAPPDVASGIGLRSIREQVEAFGGKFDMESGPNGTKLVVSVALSPEE